MPYRTITQAIDRLRTRHELEPSTARDLRRKRRLTARFPRT
jgi:hypothetical protein